MPVQPTLGKSPLALIDINSPERDISPNRALVHSIELHATELALVIKFASPSADVRGTRTSPWSKVLPLTTPLPSPEEIVEWLRIPASWTTVIQSRLSALSARPVSSPKTNLQSGNLSGSLGCFSSLGSLGILTAEAEETSSTAWEQDSRAASGGRSRPTSGNTDVAENDISGDEVSDPLTVNDENAVSATIIENYIELLYEDGASKLKCVEYLKSIARQKANVDLLASNAPLLSALARTLREDAKGSPKLAAGILSVIEQIAMNLNHHSALSVQKIGDICLKLLALETNRCEFWYTSPPKSSATITAQALLLQKCMRVLYWLSHSKSAKRKLAARSAVTTVLEATAARCAIEEKLLSDIQKQLPQSQRPQSVAEQASERSKRLTAATMRYVYEVITFLTPLSHYMPIVAEIQAKSHLINSLLVAVSAMPSSKGSSSGGAMKLLINLAHDLEIQKSLVSTGILHLIVDCLQNDEPLVEYYVLLYIFSLDEKHNSIMSFSEVPTLVINRLLKIKDSLANLELFGLAINLATNEKSAEAMANGGNIPKLWSRAVSRMDYLSLKLLRNLAAHRELIDCFKPHIGEIWTSLSSATSTNHHVELLGILNSLTRHLVESSGSSSEVVKIVETQTSVVSALAESLKKVSAAESAGRSADDDVLLEGILVINAICMHPRGSATICTALGAKLLAETIFELFQDRDEDEAILLATINCFNSLMGGAPAFRARCAEISNLASVISGLLTDPSPAIQSAAENAYSTLSGCDELRSITDEIKKARFQAKYSVWLANFSNERQHHTVNKSNRTQNLPEAQLGSQSPRTMPLKTYSIKSSKEKNSQGSELFRSVNFF